MPNHAPDSLSYRLTFLLSFAAIYLIWGSTFLAIHFAIDTIPPFIMAATRFLSAGILLFAIARGRGAAVPRRDYWQAAMMAGVLMLVGGNGAVSWAQQRVPSGVTALLVAVVPLWMVLLDWLWQGSGRPRREVFAGLGLGLVGIGLLVGPGNIAGEAVDPLGATVLTLGSFSWAVGSLYAQRSRLATSPPMITAMQMLGGGAGLLALSALTGEWGRFDVAQVSVKSGLALAYLTVLGGVLAFTAYTWLLHHTTASRVATYAYVNPVVAVFLGWALASEPLTPRILLASAVIVAAVALITLYGASRRPARRVEIEASIAPLGLSGHERRVETALSHPIHGGRARGGYCEPQAGGLSSDSSTS